MSIAACVALLLQLQDPPLQPAWTVDFEDIILGTPAAHGDLVFAASKDGKVRAFKAETGEPAWWFDMKVFTLSNLVVFKDRLFVPGSPRSILLDPKTGKVLRDEIPGSSRVIAGVSRLYLIESLLWAADGLHHVGSRTISSYDPATGKSPWKDLEACPGISTAIESGGKLYVAGDRQLVALEAGTGKQTGEAYNSLIAGALHAAADKDRLFLLADGARSVLCLSKTTLKEQWTCEVKGNVRSIPPILLPDRLILFPLPNVVAIDLKTGKESWKIPLEGEAQFSTTPPAMRGSEICVGSRGVVYAIDAAAGKATWILRTIVPDKLPNVSQPAWAGDRLLYAVGRKLMCFKPK